MRQTDINRGRTDGTTTPAPWAERKQKQPPPHITHTHTHTRLVPEQVAAHTDDSVPGSVQTNVALEGGPVRLPVALPAAAVAAQPVAAVAALPGRESCSAGRPAVTRGPGIRGRHNIVTSRERKVANQSNRTGPDPCYR